MRPILLLPLLTACAAPITAPVVEARTSTHDAERGRALFLHAWVENDALSHGNGHGPVANARACVDCHAQGALGGGGGLHRNVRPRPEGVGGEGTLANVLGSLGLNTASASNALGVGGLGVGGLGGSGFGRGGLLLGGPSGPRNTPALFGAGLLDAIPDEVLEARAADFGGRVGRDDDGRATRFGWKGEVAHLRDFVSQACALELGLTTSTHAELTDAEATESPALDLDDAQVDALTAFVAALPVPDETLTAEDGRARFRSIGCASCHAESLGDVEGVYSDLLLHDLGPRLSDHGSVYGAQQPAEMARFWRTPPLWGVRDSGPWLHDGRATSLEQAIRMHDGEAADARAAFLKLEEDERASVVRFLESLVAPGLSQS